MPGTIHIINTVQKCISIPTSPNCASHFIRVVTVSKISPCVTKITPAVTLVNEILTIFYIIECHRCQPIQEIIVVATNIDHFCSLLFHHLHDNFEEIRMLCLPLPGAAFAQGASRR